MNRKIFFLLRLAFGLGLLAYLVLAKANPGKILSTIGQASPIGLALAFSLHASGILILTMRWRMILAARGASFSLQKLVQFNLVAKFFNHFLPSGFGGDIVRISDTRGIRDGLSGSFAVVVYERLSGIFALTLFALAASLARPSLIKNTPVIPLALGVALIVMLALALLSPRLPPDLPSRLPTRIPRLRRLLSAMGRIQGVLADCLTNKPLIRKTLYSALLLQFNVILYYYFIGRALGLFRIPFSDYFFTIPMLIIFLTIPLTINGIGVRDLIFIRFLSLYNYPASAAIAFALMDVLFNLVLGAIGGIIYIMRKK